MLKHLNFQEMVGLTSPWVNDTAIKNTFLSISEVAAFHPQVVQLHTELVAVQPLGASRPRAPERRGVPARLGIARHHRFFLSEPRSDLMTAKSESGFSILRSRSLQQVLVELGHIA